MVARDLEKQTQDATSPLRAGTITRFIQALELPPLQPHENAMQQHKLVFLFTAIRLSSNGWSWFVGEGW